MAGATSDEAVDHVLVERISGRCDGSVIDVTPAEQAQQPPGGRWPGAEPARSPLARTGAAAPCGLAC